MADSEWELGPTPTTENDSEWEVGPVPKAVSKGSEWEIGEAAPATATLPKNSIIDRGYDIDPTDGIPAGRMTIDRSVLNDQAAFAQHLYDQVKAGRPNEDIEKDLDAVRFGDQATAADQYRLKDPTQIRAILDYYRNGGLPSGVSFANPAPNREAPQTGAELSAPPTLSPTEVLGRQIGESASRYGPGLLQNIGRTVLGTDAEETLEARGANEQFWKDQERRTENPILDTGAKFIGDVIGSADPTYLIAPGQSAAARIAAQAGIGGAVDIANQGMENAQGLQSGIDAERLGMSVLGQAGFEGAGELVSKGLRKLRPEAPTEAAPATAQTRLADIIRQQGQEKSYPPVGYQAVVEPHPDGSGTKTITYIHPETGEVKATGFAYPDGKVALTDPATGGKAQLSDGELSQIKQSAGIEEPVTKGPTKSDLRVQELDDHIKEITQGWTNAPKFNVVKTVRSLPKEVYNGMRRDGALTAPAIFDEDGNVHIIASNVKSPEILTAGIYHEALGHSGLKNLFQKDLDNALQNIYDRNGLIRKKVDEYFARKGHDKLYRDPATRTMRGVEEVLAELSEKGEIKPAMINHIIAIVRQWGRRMGFKWADKMTWSEVQHILAQAHATVTKGEHTSNTFEGVRYMFTGAQGEMEKNLSEGRGYFDDGKGYLNRAIDAETSGEDLSWGSPVHRETGWFIGPDGKARREINDQHAKINEDKLNELIRNPLGSVNLGDVIDHPELFSRYPSFKEMPVTVESNPGYAGSFHPQSESISLKVDRNISDIRKTLLHEIQHAVQHEEDFALGGNPSSAHHSMSKEKLHEVTSKVIDYYKTLEKQANERTEVLKRWEEIPLAKELRDATNDQNFKEVDRLEEEIIKGFGQKDGNIYGLVHTQGFETFEFVQNFLNVAKRHMPLDNAVFKQFEAANMARAKQIELEAAKERGKKGDLVYALRNVPDLGNQAYEHLFGEVEARDTAHRADMSERSREETEPYKAEPGLEPNDFIFSHRSDFEQGAIPASASKYMMAKDMAGSINLDKFDATDDVKEFIRDIAKKLPKQEPMTEDQIMEEAVFMGMNNKKAMRTLVGLSPAEITAMRLLVERNADRLDRLSKKVTDGTATEAQQQKFVRGMAIHARVQERLTHQTSNAARVLRALRINVEGVSAERAARVKAALADLEGIDLSNPDNIKYMAELIQKADGDPAKIAKITKDAMGPLPEDYLTSFRYSMMLSGIGTHVKNFLGNFTMMTADMLEHGGAAVLGKLRPGSLDDKVLMREVAMRNWGMMRALMDAQTYKDTATSWKQGVPAHQISKIEVGNALLHPVLETPKKALAASDSFFRSLIENADHYGMAVRTAFNEGLGKDGKLRDGYDMWDRVQELINDPTPEMIDHSNRHTAVIQLIHDTSPLARIIELGKARRAEMGLGSRTLRLALQLALPFTRVTDNLFFSAIRRSPLSFMDKVTREDFKAGGAQRDLAISRTLMGSAVLGWLYTKAMSDELSGDGPENIARKTELQATGWQPNSIKVGDTWYSLSGYDAIGVNANIVSNLVQRKKDGKLSDEDLTSEIVQLVANIGGQMSNNTFTSQIGELMQLAEAGPMGESRIANYTANMASSFEPAIMKQANKNFIDTAVRDTTGDGSLSGKVKGRLMDGVPGLSSKLPQKYDVFGRPMNTKDRTFVGVGASKTNDKDPVVAEVARLSQAVGKAVIGPVKRSDLKKFEIKDAAKLQEYQRLSGQYIYNDLKTEMADPSWKTLSDAEKIKLIKEIKTDQRANAREDLFGEPPETEEEE